MTKPKVKSVQAWHFVQVQTEKHVAVVMKMQDSQRLLEFFVNKIV